MPQKKKIQVKIPFGNILKMDQMEYLTFCDNFNRLNKDLKLTKKGVKWTEISINPKYQNIGELVCYGSGTHYPDLNIVKEKYVQGTLIVHR